MASIAPDDWSPSRLGGAIRALRVSRGLSVTELARRSGLSQSFLSQVEIGRTDISVGRLVRLARALDVGLADLIEDPAASDHHIVRAGDRVELPTRSEGMRLYLLARSLDQGRINGLGYLEPAAVAGPIYSTPGSESFLYVVAGVAAIELTNGAALTLNAGDSASYRADEFQSMRNARDDEQLVFLWVQAGLDPEDSAPTQ
jgi:transcriptional regulator with XRE-family HTH domain